MKALCKLLILSRVADEARIMLAVREADAAKKRERQRPGLLERAIIDGARSLVDTCFQADNAGKISIPENSPK